METRQSVDAQQLEKIDSAINGAFLWHRHDNLEDKARALDTFACNLGLRNSKRRAGQWESASPTGIE